MPKFKYAKLTCNGNVVVGYAGEEIPELIRRIGEITETEALNILGERGYRVYCEPEKDSFKLDRVHTSTHFRLEKVEKE